MAAPSAAAVWWERYQRALEGRQFCEEIVDHTHNLLRVEEQLRGPIVLVPGQGWQPNPHQGDEQHAAAERRRLWAEAGAWLGIRPPPDEFFGTDR